MVAMVIGVRHGALAFRPVRPLKPPMLQNPSHDGCVVPLLGQSRGARAQKISKEAPELPAVCFPCRGNFDSDRREGVGIGVGV